MTTSNLLLETLNHKGKIVEGCYFSDDPALRAISTMAILYLVGLGVERSNETAKALFEIAAEKGEKEALFQIALLKEVESDPLAIQYYEKSARQGHPLSMYKLGLNCLLKDNLDVEKANAYFSQATQYNDARVMRCLTILYENGSEQFPANLEKTYEMCQKGAKLGDLYCKWRLGVMYEQGQGVEVNLQKAFELYQEAVEGELPDAQNNLAVLYCKGEVVEQDFKKARMYFLLAAEQNHVEAMLNLSKLYSGPLPDEAKAKEWAEKAKALLDGNVAIKN